MKLRIEAIPKDGGWFFGIPKLINAETGEPVDLGPITELSIAFKPDDWAIVTIRSAVSEFSFESGGLLVEWPKTIPGTEQGHAILSPGVASNANETPCLCRIENGWFRYDALCPTHAEIVKAQENASATTKADFTYDMQDPADYGIVKIGRRPK